MNALPVELTSLGFLCYVVSWLALLIHTQGHTQLALGFEEKEKTTTPNSRHKLSYRYTLDWDFVCKNMQQHPKVASLCATACSTTKITQGRKDPPAAVWLEQQLNSSIACAQRPVCPASVSWFGADQLPT